MTAILITLDAILGFYWWLVIAAAIFSWLYAFNIVNNSNPFVGQIANLLYQLDRTRTSADSQNTAELGKY